jgi:hypothetical protein
LRQARKHCARHFVVYAIRAIEHNNIPEKELPKQIINFHHTHTHTNVEIFGHFSNKIIGKFFGFSSVNSTKFDIFGGNQNPIFQYQKN